MSCCSLWIAVTFCNPLLKKEKKKEREKLSVWIKNQKMMDPRKHFDVEKMLLNGPHQNQHLKTIFFLFPNCEI